MIVEDGEITERIGVVAQEVLKFMDPHKGVGYEPMLALSALFVSAATIARTQKISYQEFMYGAESAWREMYPAARW